MDNNKQEMVVKDKECKKQENSELEQNKKDININLTNCETANSAVATKVTRPCKYTLIGIKSGLVIGLIFLIIEFFADGNLLNGIILCLFITLFSMVFGAAKDMKNNVLNTKNKYLLALLVIGMIISMIILINYSISRPHISSPNKTITSNQGNETNRSAFDMATYCVRQKLKSPSTADFPAYSDDYISHSDDEYTVSAYVDAQNSFGATVRTYFIVRMTRSGYNWYDWTNVTVDFIE